MEDPIKPMQNIKTKKCCGKFCKVFSIILVILLIASIALTCILAKRVCDQEKRIDKLEKQMNKSKGSDKKDDSKNDDSKDNKKNRLIIKEWNIQFTIPDSLTDVRYVIDDDTAFFVALPSDGSVEYPSNLNDEDIKTMALAILFRGTYVTRTNGIDDIEYDGKKIGNFYYHTAWSFNSIATGMGIVNLFGGNDDDLAVEMEGKVFKELNEVMLPSIKTVK